MNTFTPHGPAYPPSTPVPGGSSMPAGSSVSPEVVRVLAETKPWVKFLAIMGMVGAGFMVLGGLAMLATPMAWVSLVYLLMSFLYVVPSVYLYRYAEGIGSLKINPESLTLEQALAHQRSFWRFTGITTAVMLVIYALAFAAGIAYSVLTMA